MSKTSLQAIDGLPKLDMLGGQFCKRRRNRVLTERSERKDGCFLSDMIKGIRSENTGVSDLTIPSIDSSFQG